MYLCCVYDFIFFFFYTKNTPQMLNYMLGGGKRVNHPFTDTFKFKTVNESDYLV